MKVKLKSKGMTLIEVIIVVAIIGIVIGMILPNQLFYQHYRLKIYAKQLCNDIRYVRDWNMNYKESCALTLQTDGYSIIKNNRVYKKNPTSSLFVIAYDQKHSIIQFTMEGVPKMLYNYYSKY